FYQGKITLPRICSKTNHPDVFLGVSLRRIESVQRWAFRKMFANTCVKFNPQQRTGFRDFYVVWHDGEFHAASFCPTASIDPQLVLGCNRPKPCVPVYYILSTKF